MTEKVLAYINKKLTDAGINYEFREWTGKIVYPYFVGTYTESPAYSENGQNEATFTLDGFTRGSWAELEKAKEKIIETFYYNTSILDDKSGLDVSYYGSLVVPTGDAELKRIQINLSIKEWRTI